MDARDQNHDPLQDQNIAMTSLADVFRDDLMQILQSDEPSSEEVLAMMDNIGAMLDMTESHQHLARLERLRSQIMPNGGTLEGEPQSLPQAKTLTIAQWLLRLLDSLDDPEISKFASIKPHEKHHEEDSEQTSEIQQTENTLAAPLIEDPIANQHAEEPLEVFHDESTDDDLQFREAAKDVGSSHLASHIKENSPTDAAAEIMLPEANGESPIPMLSLTDIPPDSNLSDEQTELVEAFWAEICELEDDLTEALDVIAAADHNRRPYIDLLQSLAETSSYVGITGLQHFFDSLSIRLQSEENIGAQQIQHLKKWPLLVKDYLYEQASESSCLAMLEYLEDASWSDAIDSEDQQALLFALVEFDVSGEALEQTPAPVYTEADVALDISADVTLEVKHAFLQDAPLHTHAIFDALSNIADDDIPDKQWLIKAQRASHSLKGSANLLGIKGVANISHALEDIFEILAQGSTPVSEQLYDLLMEASDCLSTMVDFLGGRDQPPNNSFAVLQQLVHWNNPDGIDLSSFPATPDNADTDMVSTDNQSDANAQQVAADHKRSSDRPEHPDKTPPVPSEEATSSKDDNAATVGSEVPISDFDSLVLLAEEMSINNVQGKELYKKIQSTSEDMSKHDHLLSQRRLQLEGLIDNRSMDRHTPQSGFQSPQTDDTEDAEFDPLEMDRYDELHECSHQLFESVADVRELNHKLQDQLLMLDSLMRQQHRYIDKLQHQLLSKQKLAASELTGRLQRCVRQACRAAGKSAVLDVIGDDLEVDRLLIEQLADPLMHLLRNAVDHGIEISAEREQSGKNPRGRIQVQYAQVGRFLQIVIEDDGGGLDFERIFRKALKSGILAEDSSRPTDQELSQFVWQPGFTTRDKATQLSGRGIGMDAVRSQIESMGGNIRFDTETMESLTPGTRPLGCRLIIRVPVREITQYMLLVTVCKQRFAIPSSSLSQILATGVGELEDIAGQTYLSANDELYRYVDLAKSLFGIEETESAKPLIVAEVSGVLTAIAVDEIKSGEQLVLRTPGRMIPGLPGLFGMTILGDGTLVPVLNLVELLQTGNKSSRSMNSPVTSSQDIFNKILVVDDSLSVRQTLKQLLQDCGFTVVTACDGLEAIEKIQSETPHLLLVDMEMPRMDGLELTRQLRQTPEHNQLPILMLTSRSQQKHRELAQRAGVNGYTTKPYNENDLMDKIQELLG